MEREKRAVSACRDVARAIFEVSKKKNNTKKKGELKCLKLMPILRLVLNRIFEVYLIAHYVKYGEDFTV